MYMRSALQAVQPIIMKKQRKTRIRRVRRRIGPIPSLLHHRNAVRAIVHTFRFVS